MFFVRLLSLVGVLVRQSRFRQTIDVFGAIFDQQMHAQFKLDLVMILRKFGSKRDMQDFLRTRDQAKISFSNKRCPPSVRCSSGFIYRYVVS